MAGSENVQLSSPDTIEEEETLFDLENPYLRQILSCSSAIVGSFVAGLAASRKHADVGPFFPKRTDVPGYYLYNSYLAELSAVIPSAAFAYVFGRKKLCIITTIFFLASFIIYNYYYTSARLRVIAMFVSELGATVQGVAITLHTAEVSSPLMRGPLISSFFPAFFGGIVVGKTFSTKYIHILGIVTSIASFVLAVAYTPESPYWLAWNGRRNEAEELFIWLRAGDNEMDEANVSFDRAEADGAEGASRTLLRLLSVGFLVPTLLLIGVQLAMENACWIVYAGITDKAMDYFRYENTLTALNTTEKVPTPEEEQFPIWFTNLISFSGPFLACFVIVFVDRRIFYFSTLFVSYYLFHITWEDLKATGRSYFNEQVCFLAIHVGGRQVALILSTELFPGSVRPFGIAVYELVRRTIDITDIIQILFHYKPALASPPQNAWFFFRIAFIPMGLTWCVMFLPETRNLSLNETEELGSHLWPHIFGKEDVDDEEIEE